MSTIALFIAHDGYQPVEYGDPKRILEGAGHKVLTVSDKPGQATAKDSTFTAVDHTFEDFPASEIDGVFLVGGPGALTHLDNPTVYKIFKDAKNANKIYGAICISPRILARAGLLEGKKATGWNQDEKLEEILSSHGAEYIAKPLVQDGKLITANGPAAASNFGQAILRSL